MIMRIELVVMCMAVSFISGYALSSHDHAGKETVMEQFQSWQRQAQQDFIVAATIDKDMLKRAIAEDWCAINKNTQRVCWNAKLNHPIRGVK